MKDLTKGRIFPNLIAFTIPVLLGNLLQNFYAVVDTFLVGRFVSLNALAAIGSTGSTTFLIFALTMGLATGFGVIISRYFGAGDHKNMKKAIAMTYVLSAGFSILFAVICGLSTTWMIRVMKTPDVIFHDAWIYTFISAVGIPFTMGYNTLATVMRALGDSKTPLYLLLVSCVLNIIGDIFLITVVHWGVFGVAIATITAQGISAILCYIYMVRKFPELKMHREDFSIDRRMIRQLLPLGLTSSLQYSVCSLGTMFVQAKANQLGADIVAAYAVGLKLEGLLSTFFPALGVAMTTFTAQNLGSGNFHRIRQGARCSIIMSFTMTLVFIAVGFLFGEKLALLFIEPGETEIIAEIVRYVRAITIFFMPLALIFIFRSSSQGLGSGLIPLWSSIFELLSRLVIAFTLIIPMGFDGLPLSNVVSWTTGGIYCIIAFYYRLRRMEKRHITTA